MPPVNLRPASFGAEHELSDWDTEIGLPEGFGRSPDYTIVNSNGVAAQPNPQVYKYGGEINTPPTKELEGQIWCLSKILELHSNCSVNHRSNLHIHIQVPGLASNLRMLKQVQRYIHEELPKVINEIEPIPRGVTLAEKKRERRRKISHHTFLTEHRVKRQMSSRTVKEFFEYEVPVSKAGAVMWHAQPRVCVNLRQLLQTDTVEFRHFPGTLSQMELETCLHWCFDFTNAALSESSIAGVYQAYRNQRFPSFPEFNEELEIGYQATAYGVNKSAEIKQNIELILSGKFKGSEAEAIASARARGLK